MRFAHFTLTAAASAFGLSHALSTSLSHKVDWKVLEPRLDQLPACATSCFFNTLAESPCKTADLSCICSHIDSITVDMLPCTTARCSTMDQIRTKRYADTTCDVPVRNIAQRLIISQWALFSLSLVFVGLRFISRLPRFGGRLGWDDWTIVVVLLLSLIVNIISHFLLGFGVGQDVWMLEEDQLTSFQKSSFTAELIYVVGVTLLKISILRLYLRMFSFKKQAYFLMCFSACYGSIFCIATLAACKPFTFYFTRWNSEYEGTCLNVEAMISASAIINIILDGIITLLPVTQILTLQMNIKKKLMVSFIFMAGFFVTGISIARYVRFEQASLPNFTYEYVDVGILSLAEVDLSIITSSVPAIVSLIRQLTGTASTTKASYESRPRPSGSGRVARSGQVENKGLRGRWQGFTDVFTTQASTTQVTVQSRNHEDLSNDEFELLDETLFEQSGRPASRRLRSEWVKVV